MKYKLWSQCQSSRIGGVFAIQTLLVMPKLSDRRRLYGTNSARNVIVLVCSPWNASPMLEKSVGFVYRGLWQ
jgi:hypothetical protein